MLSDIEIAQGSKMRRIAELAQDRLGIPADHLEPYGHYKAKLSLEYLETLRSRPNGKLILVTRDQSDAGRGGQDDYDSRFG